jgi:drug/metabolite transporter (DMT)-like permease
MSAIKLDVDNDNNHAPAHENSSSRKETDEHVSDSLTFRAMVLFQVVAYGSYSILVHLCERDGTIMFSSTTMNLVLELIKLAFSFTALFCTEKQLPVILIGKRSLIRHSLFYSVPGVLYFINNNLAVHMQLQMDPASYQILSHFKIVSTAILYRLIIKRKLSYRQWFAVTLLFCGSLFYSLGIFSWQNRSNEETVCSA